MRNAIRMIALAMVFVASSAMAQSASDLAAWADGTFGGAIDRRAAVAATVTVVRDGKVVLTRTYGMADARAKRPIDPRRDRFLIASVTKTFTATAVAQLLADHRIDSIDDPANKYLKRLQLPRRFGREITIRELLTHSAGFEERGWGIGKSDSVKPPVPGGYIAARLPEIVRAPGTRIVYANIDPPLLGALIEDITGQTLRDYMRHNLLDPLGMRDTELVYDPAAPRLIKSYGVRADGTFAPAPHDINVPFYAPTGSIQTTAQDMAKYIAAQLGGRPDILSPQMLRSLHSPLMRNAPGLDALGMFFFIGDWNGERTLEHAGVFSGFQSELILIPDRNMGIFYSWAGAPAPGNSATPLQLGTLSAQVYGLIIGPHHDARPLSPQPELAPFIGRYWRERRPHTTPETLVALTDVVDVARHPEHGLMIGGDGPYDAIGPNLFARASRDGVPGKVYGFTQDEILETSNYGRRVEGLSDPKNVLRVGYVSLALLLTGLFALLFWRRGRHRFLGLGAGIVALGIPAALLAPAASFSDLVSDIIQGNPWRFTTLKVLAFTTLALAILLPVQFWRMRHVESEWCVTVERVHLAVLWLAALGLIFALIFVDLL